MESRAGLLEMEKPLKNQRFEMLVVETAGIEPASASPLQTVLHT